MSARDWPPEVVEALDGALGPGRVHGDVALSAFTTYRVGGPADLFAEAAREEEVARAAATARRYGVPVTWLGGGSNTLVADAGVKGLVLRIHGGDVVADGESGVRADAGVALNGLVRWTIGRGFAGLEAWAGTPGTVGGAIVGNAHYGGRSIGDLVANARLLRPDGEVVDVPGAEMDFRYDHSRLQVTGECLLSARFLLTPGADPTALRSVARESLAHRKRTQPLGMASAGCVFQNPDPARDQMPPGVPWSAGALIDRAGLKGRRIGGARVSTLHANFIVNEGGASAADILELIALCRDEVRRRFGVTLREEIVGLGF